MEEIKDIEDQIYDLQDKEQTVESIDKHEKRYKVNEQILNTITQSGFFSTSTSDKFKAKLVELSYWMHKWLSYYKDKFKKLLKPYEDIIEVSIEADKAVKKAERSLDDMIKMATMSIKKENLHADIVIKESDKNERGDM